MLRDSLVAQMVKNLSVIQETWATSPWGCKELDKSERLTQTDRYAKGI